MKVTKLNNPPTSGLFDETHFGRTDTKSLWLKIDDTSGNSFIFSFGGGDSKLESSVVQMNGDNLNVLYNGIFYSIDTLSKSLIISPNNDYYVDFIYNQDNSFLCLGTFWGVEIFKGQKLIKDLRPEFIDGIKFVSATSNIIKGQLYNVGEDWQEFTIDLDSLWLESNGVTTRM